MGKIAHTYGALLLLMLGVIFIPLLSRAQSADELRDTIEERRSDIEKLESEIAQYENQLVQIGKQKQTLQSAVDELDISRQKVQAGISLTSRKISGAQATINTLAFDISEKEAAVTLNQAALAQVLRAMNETESVSLVELVLNGNELAAALTDMEAMRKFHGSVQTNVAQILQSKQELESVKRTSEDEKATLVSYQSELSAQKRTLDINRSEKNSLLRVTKNTESNYQDLIAEKQRQKEEFEAELAKFEAELQYQLDPDSIPPAGKGVLSWPLVKVYITQYFGNTKFAQSGAYNGSGHNGIDFRASVGTPIYAALAGTVEATGNTDAYAGCYSYGKWILIRHGNGVSTLYAHLSERSVSPGDYISTGELIGFSGNTGYSTGPHLHFGVYVSDAVRIVKMGEVKAKTNCAQATVPVSAYSGYLNPMDYLP